MTRSSMARHQRNKYSLRDVNTSPWWRVTTRKLLYVINYTRLSRFTLGQLSRGVSCAVGVLIVGARIRGLGSAEIWCSVAHSWRSYATGRLQTFKSALREENNSHCYTNLTCFLVIVFLLLCTLRGTLKESWQVGPKISMSIENAFCTYCRSIYTEFRYCCVN